MKKIADMFVSEAVGDLFVFSKTKLFKSLVSGDYSQTLIEFREFLIELFDTDKFKLGRGQTDIIRDLNSNILSILPISGWGTTITISMRSGVVQFTDSKTSVNAGVIDTNIILSKLLSKKGAALINSIRSYAENY